MNEREGVELEGVHEAIVESPLGSVPKRKMLTLESSATIDEAVGAMNAARTGYALVVDSGKLVGIVTERDMLTKVLGGAKVAPTSPVSKIMTANPEVLPNHASIRSRCSE